MGGYFECIFVKNEDNLDDDVYELSDRLYNKHTDVVCHCIYEPSKGYKSVCQSTFFPSCMKLDS